MYSHGDAAQEAKCPGSGGKTRGPITAISSGAELAKAGTPSNVLLGLIKVYSQVVSLLILKICMPLIIVGMHMLARYLKQIQYY